eukprot:5305155-Pyramimonas_sp.AAC.1
MRCWPPNYNNNGSRLMLPHNVFPNRALARDFLTMYSGIALSRETSSQLIQTPRPRHSGVTLS